MSCVCRQTVPCWVQIWLMISSALCMIDVVYTMLRPRTLRDGDLGKYFQLWNIYSDVDLRYGNEKDIVTMSTGRVMVVELLLNVLALVLIRCRSPHGILLAFTTSVMVFWKTVWYMVMYIRPPEGTVQYLSPDAGFWKTFWVFWVADGIWIVVPLLVILRLYPMLLPNKENEYRLNESMEYSEIPIVIDKRDDRMITRG